MLQEPMENQTSPFSATYNQPNTTVPSFSATDNTPTEVSVNSFGKSKVEDSGNDLWGDDDMPPILRSKSE